MRECVMQPILERCCGVDVYKDMIEACIVKGIDNPEFIRMQFSTFPNSLKEFVERLYKNDCYHIAMESTGVYWRPVYKVTVSLLIDCHIIRSNVIIT